MRKNPATRKALFILPILIALCLGTSASLAKEKEEDTRPESQLELGQTFTAGAYPGSGSNSVDESANITGGQIRSGARRRLDFP